MSKVEDSDRPWLNEDFKVSKSAVTLCLKGLGSGDDLPAGSILQIQNISNVSVPSAKASSGEVQYDPRNHILKILLFDGKESSVAILTENHPKLTTETPPGTKIKTLRSIPFGPGRILKLTRGNVEVIGGHVEKLVQNWIVQREHAKKSEWGKLIVTAGQERPPPFKPFNAPGGNIPVQNRLELRNAKAMEILENAKATKELESENTQKSEFEVHRQEAISDLVKQQSNTKTEFSHGRQLPSSTPVELEQQKVGSRGLNERRGSSTRGHHRGAQRKAKQEEEALLSQYTYRGTQNNLKDHLNQFFGGETSEREQASPVESLNSQFSRLDFGNGEEKQNHYLRGGGRGQNFGYHRGGGGRGRGRGGRGRSSKGPNSRGYVTPSSSSSSYVPDMSSFPTLS